MRLQFPLFTSHLDLAHSYWQRLLKKGDWAIDATCGNGHDTLKLAQLLGPGSGLIAMDIQEQAIRATVQRIEEQLEISKRPQIIYCHQSHERFPPIAHDKGIRLIVYNLGYLPKGNKQLTTETRSTLESLYQAKGLILSGGAISITCYPGHPEGAREEEALLGQLDQFPPNEWNVCHHRFSNRHNSPSLILIQKYN